jgi:hypothetical protein
MFDGRETRNRQDACSTNKKCLMEEKQAGSVVYK